MAESGAKVGAIEVGVFAGPRVVGLMALRAEDFYAELSGYVRQANRQN